MTLSEFLLARLHEDGLRRYAYWHDIYCPVLYDAKEDCTCGSQDTIDSEVEAKRRIVEQETAARAMRPSGYVPWWDVQFVDDAIELIDSHGNAVVSGDEARKFYADWLEQNTDPVTDTPTLRLLALPYAEHPDYDESWRP